MASLADQLAALPAMSPAQLRAEWRRVYRAAPPRLTPDLLVRGIAYRLQERSHGGLPAGTARELDRAAKRLLRGDSVGALGDTRLKPGTRLVRHWNGTSYSVLVSGDGFIMDGRSFTSLSHVAEAITGAHWSGPRFFGVKASVSGPVGAAAASSARRVSAARAVAV
ncbi:hypothetical protein FHS79_003726 [Polymorphobacter multimanifer]|uniref:DUF2924 domain-containing protein n=2 Tax=Polymorphobacter multimanifer TaxID=1070431 RepID=A0A841LEP7_9SPHN|nr:DUF2924 domain-containing protein [Polymorphobacter multimanifer]MBB6229523.1 hypothetical protein [Polymorphobacter multimanifer]